MKNKLLPLAPLAIAIALAGCTSDTVDVTPEGPFVQPELSSRHKPIIEVDGYRFRDMLADGQLHPFEDWRLSPQERAEDLLSRMSLREKVGMMLINTLNSDEGGRPPATADRYVNNEYMTRFIFRNPVVKEVTGPGAGWGGAEITPREAAEFTNAVQELNEQTRLGIPALFKSNARNHIDPQALAGINVNSGAFSSWPKEAGLAATGDLELISEFADIMAEEWTSIGLRGMYGYMLDLATEPRWYRVHETFTEDADYMSDIAVRLVQGLQGEDFSLNSVALTLKHFPGGGPQEGGGDPHYWWGANQNYEGENFDYHVKPFKAAIDVGVAAMMPYYGIPVDQKYQPNDVGMAFSEGIVTELLRQELEFDGYVNSDTGIIGSRAWGLEDKSREEQLIIAIDAGTDVFSGFSDNDEILSLVERGLVSEERVDTSVRRMLRRQFELGIFENPYVDPDAAEETIGKAEFQERADYAMRKSIVLLENDANVLPLDSGASLYTMGMDADVINDGDWGVTAVSGDYDPEEGEVRPEIPEGTDYAVIRVRMNNDNRNSDLGFGGANPDELDFITFTTMHDAVSWGMTPSLPDIQEVMEEIGAENTIISVYFRQPFVPDEDSGVLDAGAILGTFGVSDIALMDVLSGEFSPMGKMPFAIGNSLEAVQQQMSDVPGYKPEHTLWGFGYGMEGYTK